MSYSKQNFRSGDTLYASQLNAMDDEIAVLEAEVESTKNMVGSPLTASTAAGMSDQTKIYVYTGNETGYTAGHWYYYNGTAWTDGGVYNSVAVNTDTSLTVSGQAADSKAVGDAIDEIDGDLSDVKSDLNQTLTKPNTDGTSGQVLATNGNGGTYWTNQTGGGGGGGSNEFVTPEDYGAVGDGETDDTNAVRTALSSGKKVIFSNKTYKITPITVAKSVEMVGEDGAKIITAPHTSALTFSPTLKNRLSLAEDYDCRDNTADSGVSRLKLTSLGNVSIGDLVYIYATNQRYIPARQYYYKGCTALVTKIDSGNSTIYIDFAMPFDIEANGCVVDVYNPVNIRINNVDFESSLNLASTSDSMGVRISYGAYCDIRNCKFYGFTNHIALYNCTMSNIEDCCFTNAKPDNTLHWDGYGIMIASCNVTTIRRVTANCGQHAISTGGNVPVFGTIIQDCRLFSECATYAVGLHDNDHDCVVERSVIGGIWGCGNLTVQNVRMVSNANGGIVLLTGNPGSTRTNARFNNVDFGELNINIHAYPQGALEAYNNDFGNIVFENCTGGLFRIFNLSDNNLISGSNIELIHVNHWQECNGFIMNYGTISELNISSLVFDLKVENGYITSQTKRIINSPCVVLKEYNGDDEYDNVNEVKQKADSIYKSSGTLYTGASLEDSGNGIIKNLKVYGKPTDINALKIVTFGVMSDNIFPELEGFEIFIENAHINGVSGVRNMKETLVPEKWKRKTFQISCMIDNTNGVTSTLSSVDVHLYNSKGREIYRGPAAGLYEASIFKSQFSFVIPDEAYRMVINARLYADGEGKSIRAYDFKLIMKQELSLSCAQFNFAIPAMTTPTYVDGNGNPYVSNYYDLERGLFVRELDFFRTDVIPSNAFESWNDYFDESIVGGFIPSEIVNQSDGIGRNLSDYYSNTTTILETNTPPTNAPCVWIHDGGIGFAHYVTDVGERTMTALLNYVKAQSYNIICRLNGTTYDYIDATQIMLYNKISSYEEGTIFSINNDLPFSLDYVEQLPKYISETITEYDHRPFNLIKTVTLEEEKGVVYINKDENNESFALSEVLLYLELAAGNGTGQGVIAINHPSYKPDNSELTSGPNLVFSFYSTSAMKKTAFLECKGGRFFGKAVNTSISNYYTGGTDIKTSRNASGLIECDKIRSLNFSSLNSYKLGIGSVIKVYGR